MTIIQTKKNYPHLMVGALLLVCATSFCIFTIPHFMLTMSLLPGTTIKNRIMNGDTVTDDEYATLRMTRIKAQEQHSNSMLDNDLVLSLMPRITIPHPAPKEIAEAIRLQERALARAPADSFAWSRLTYLYMLHQESGFKSAKTLAHSLETGFFEPRLLMPHLNTAILLKNYLDDTTKNQIPTLIRAAWKSDAWAVVKGAREYDFAPMVADALRDNPQDLENFNKMLGAK